MAYLLNQLHLRRENAIFRRRSRSSFEKISWQESYCSDLHKIIVLSKRIISKTKTPKAIDVLTFFAKFHTTCRTANCTDHIQMNNEEFNKIWQRLDSRIEVINDRTKNHTIYIKELKGIKRKVLVFLFVK